MSYLARKLYYFHQSREKKDIVTWICMIDNILTLVLKGKGLSGLNTFPNTVFYGECDSLNGQEPGHADCTGNMKGIQLHVAEKGLQWGCYLAGACAHMLS